MAAKHRYQNSNRAYGFHAVEAIISRKPEQIIEVIIDRNKSQQRTRNIVALLEKQNVSFRFSNREEVKVDTPKP